MTKVVYELEVKVWQDENGKATVRSEPIYGQPMMHNLSEKEWGILKDVLDTLVSPEAPIPAIFRVIR